MREIQRLSERGQILRRQSMNKQRSQLLESLMCVLVCVCVTERWGGGGGGGGKAAKPAERELFWEKGENIWEKMDKIKKFGKSWKKGAESWKKKVVGKSERKCTEIVLQPTLFFVILKLSISINRLADEWLPSPSSCHCACILVFISSRKVCLGLSIFIFALTGGRLASQ